MCPYPFEVGVECVDERVDGCLEGVLDAKEDSVQRPYRTRYAVRVGLSTNDRDDALVER
jgi:hypothetical protein